MEKAWILYLLVGLLIVGALLIIVYRRMKRKNRQVNGTAENIATFRVRFRFRVQKYLDIKEHEYRFNIVQREVIISPQMPDVLINQSEWLVMNARGFNSESEAREFDRKLKAAVEISSVASRFGIDSGIDVPTAMFASKTVY